MQQTVREGMNNVLGHKAVPLPPHPCPHDCTLLYPVLH